MQRGRRQSAQKASTLFSSVGWALHSHCSSKREAEEESNEEGSSTESRSEFACYFSW